MKSAAGYAGRGDAPRRGDRGELAYHAEHQRRRVELDAKAAFPVSNDPVGVRQLLGDRDLIAGDDQDPLPVPPDHHGRQATVVARVPGEPGDQVGPGGHEGVHAVGVHPVRHPVVPAPGRLHPDPLAHHWCRVLVPVRPHGFLLGARAPCSAALTL